MTKALEAARRIEATRYVGSGSRLAPRPPLLAAPVPDSHRRYRSPFVQTRCRPLMTNWQPIETAPTDETVVRLKRIYQGRLVAEGLGLFGILHPAAPSRSGVGLDPLDRLTAADYEREAKDREAFVRSAKWLREDRMYLFPTPTHWMPAEQT